MTHVEKCALLVFLCGQNLMHSANIYIVILGGIIMLSGVWGFIIYEEV